jgi:magnesium-transporting ATPase (P-type)
LKSTVYEPASITYLLLYHVLPFANKVALIQQFRRIANIYFLIIAILQSIPAVSPLSPITAWAPLIIVILISMLREGNYNFNVGFEDYNRYKSDKQLNFESKTKVRRSGKFIEVTWSEVLIGDIVLVE